MLVFWKGPCPSNHWWACPPMHRNTHIKTLKHLKGISYQFIQGIILHQKIFYHCESWLSTLILFSSHDTRFQTSHYTFESQNLLSVKGFGEFIFTWDCLSIIIDNTIKKQQKEKQRGAGKINKINSSNIIRNSLFHATRIRLGGKGRSCIFICPLLCYGLRCQALQVLWTLKHLHKTPGKVIKINQRRMSVRSHAHVED